MRLTGLGPLMLLLGLPARAGAQMPAAPVPTAPAQALQPPSPLPPDLPPEPEPEPPPVPAPASAPAAEAAPSIAPVPEPPSATRSEAAPGATSKAPPPKDQPELPLFERAKWPLTVDLKLGMSWRPEADAGFDDEDPLGTELGGSLYLDITDKIAAGLEVDRVSLGRGNSINGFDSISVDYTDWSAMLGMRAYPKRGGLLDLFVGLQVGVGIQGVSATGTENNGPLMPATPYSCSGSDRPGFQIGGGIGARLMLAPRWGITARITGTGRKLTAEPIEDCARGLGSLTTVSGSLALGYDFELEQ